MSEWQAKMNILNLGYYRSLMFTNFTDSDEYHTNYSVIHPCCKP